MTIYLKKMSALRFPDHTINFFKSYFSRSFQVNIKDFYLFHKLTVDLGLLSFLLYATDMNQTVNCVLFLYTGDSCLVY